MPSNDLALATRDAFVNSIEDEVFLEIPLFTLLLAKKKIIWAGGKKVTRLVTKDEVSDLAQTYKAKEGLSSGDKDILAEPAFGWKNMQIPIVWDIDTYLQNAGDSTIVKANLIKVKVEAAQKAARRKLVEMAYATTSTDDGADFQSIAQALDHDTTYGTIARSIAAGTNTWWQGASVDGTYTDRSGSITASLSNFRRCKNACLRHVKRGSKLYVFVGDALYDAYLSVAESRKLSTDKDSSLLVKYGHDAVVIDNVEFVRDPYLTEMGRTTDFFMLNPDTWEFRINPKRNFKMTAPVWQGDQTNGLDEWLRRILVSGNLVCWKPNANMWRSNMSE